MSYITSSSFIFIVLIVTQICVKKQLVTGKFMFRKAIRTVPQELDEDLLWTSKYDASSSSDQNSISNKDDASYSTSESPVCSQLPKISIVSYVRDEFLPNATTSTELVQLEKDDAEEDEAIGQVWMAPFAATILIECQSSVPIEWTFDGPYEPEIIYIDVERDNDYSSITRKHGKQIRDPSTYCFTIFLKLVTRRISTGKYKCQAILDEKEASTAQKISKLSSSLVLYGEVNTPPFLLYQGREFTVFQEEESKTVILPCQVTNPTMVPDLFKGNSQFVQLHDPIPFHPQIGFILDLSKIPHPFDTYKCTREGGSVFITVKKLPDYRVTPAASRITIQDSSPINLTCESKFPIDLQGFIQNPNVTIINDQNAQTYKHKLIYNYYWNEKEAPVGISCVDLYSRKILHTWHSFHTSNYSDAQSGIRYDQKQQRFYCLSKSDDPPIIVIAECNSDMECSMTDKCFSWKAPFKLTNGGNQCYSENKLVRGNSCRIEDKTRFNTSNGCAYIKNMIDAGTVYCALPDNGEQVQLRFFNGLQSGADLAIIDWRTVPKSELIDIDILEQHRTFYTNESIEFECTVSKFLFAKGQIFKFKLANGTYITPNETVRSIDSGDNDPKNEFVDESVIVKTSKLHISLSSIKEVVCISPFWNSTGWMNQSIPINVIESKIPIILHRSDQVVSETVQFGTNTTLECEATGLPVPKVTWFRNGKKAEVQMEKLVGKEKVIGVLTVTLANLEDEGEYTCEASNVAGNAVLKFILYVRQSKRAIYTAAGIGLVTLTVFLVIVATLWKKLRKNQALVRKLTVKEIQEFREGDVSALRSIPDGYVRAQYLPYNKEYEIKEENLEIDEEILGSGEYGIVLKGTLRQNDLRKVVAVKTSRSPDVNHFKALLTELKMLSYIGWHDNVINLLGAVTRNLRDRDVYVVVEYCRLGDLETFLRNNRTTFLNQIVNEKIDLNLTFNYDSTQAYQPLEYTMMTQDLISWSYQISSGMEYLANKKVIHGDLATRNILLTDDRIVKITDFGLSKHLYNGSNYISHSCVNLPWKHCAPEILQYNTFSTQSDVWALGVTLWEIFSLGENPYPGIVWSWDFKNQLLQGYRMSKPIYGNDDIHNIILQCWKNVPSERVSFEELRKYFHRILHHWMEENTKNSIEPSIGRNGNEIAPVLTSSKIQIQDPQEQNFVPTPQLNNSSSSNLNQPSIPSTQSQSPQLIPEHCIIDPINPVPPSHYTTVSN